VSRVAGAGSGTAGIARRWSARGFSAQFPHQPELGQPPVPLGGVGVNLENLGCLFEGHPTEEAHFNQLSFARVELRERIAGLVNSEQVPIGLIGRRQTLGQRPRDDSATAFDAAPRAGAIDQDAAH